jgi:trimeric autotransporter adhesin
VYAGAGYLFALEGEEWKLSAYLKARNADSTDSLGFAAALSHDVAVLSANWESSAAKGINGDQSNNSSRYAGATYVFQ